MDLGQLNARAAAAGTNPPAPPAVPAAAPEPGSDGPSPKVGDANLVDDSVSTWILYSVHTIVLILCTSTIGRGTLWDCLG